MKRLSLHLCSCSTRQHLKSTCDFGQESRRRCGLSRVRTKSFHANMRQSVVGHGTHAGPISHGSKDGHCAARAQMPAQCPGLLHAAVVLLQ